MIMTYSRAKIFWWTNDNVNTFSYRKSQWRFDWYWKLSYFAYRWKKWFWMSKNRWYIINLLCFFILISSWLASRNPLDLSTLTLSYSFWHNTKKIFLFARKSQLSWVQRTEELDMAYTRHFLLHLHCIDIIHIVIIKPTRYACKVCVEILLRKKYFCFEFCLKKLYLLEPGQSDLLVFKWKDTVKVSKPW